MFNFAHKHFIFFSTRKNVQQLAAAAYFEKVYTHLAQYGRTRKTYNDYQILQNKMTTLKQTSKYTVSIFSVF